MWSTSQATKIYLALHPERTDAAQPRLSRGLIWPGNFWASWPIPHQTAAKAKTIWTGV